jgi:SAM-dependent methyltransferase
VESLYDTIGRGYSRQRRPDARIRTAIGRALGNGSVINVGAGTGSYEPSDRRVVAVELSREMIGQRPIDAAPAVQASAEHLPFGDASFDVALAVLTIHHWSDWRAGVREMARTAPRRVVFTWDPSVAGFWLVRDYVPEILSIDRRIFPSVASISSELGRVHVESVPIPHDCTDGFLGAYWRRPREYLHSSVRGAISTFAKVAGAEEGLRRLREDLDSGEWRRRNRALLRLTSLDVGYRLIIGS